MRIGLQIVDQLAFHRSPPVRVGVHSGPAIHRDGDWFGSTVNVASRVANAAKPGEVLLTDATRSQLGDGFELEARGARYLRHIPELVPVYGVAGSGPTSDRLEIDPVCRMAVSIARPDSTKKRRGLTYYFCSADLPASVRSGSAPLRRAQPGRPNSPTRFPDQSRRLRRDRRRPSDRLGRAQLQAPECRDADSLRCLGDRARLPLPPRPRNALEPDCAQVRPGTALDEERRSP